MSEGRPPEQPPEPPVAPQGLPTQIDSTPDDRSMAFICHLVGGILGPLIPLIVWLIKKDQSKFVDDQGKEALNFQLTVLIAHVILVPCMCIPFGIFLAIPLHPALRIFSIVFGIIGGLAVQKGEVYRYPITFRMIK
jgi:uncharacterized protein